MTYLAAKFTLGVGTGGQSDNQLSVLADFATVSEAGVKPSSLKSQSLHQRPI